MKKPIVFCAWEDAIGGTSAWTDIKQLKKTRPTMCYSVGWLAANKKKYITIIPHCGDQDNGYGDITIPHSQVRVLKKLKSGKRIQS